MAFVDYSLLLAAIGGIVALLTTCLVIEYNQSDLKTPDDPTFESFLHGGIDADGGGTSSCDTLRMISFDKIVLPIGAVLSTLSYLGIFYMYFVVKLPNLKRHPTSKSTPIFRFSFSIFKLFCNDRDCLSLHVGSLGCMEMRV